MLTNDEIFLDYLIANGFQPQNYKNILELIQSVPNSISKYLKDYRQFLLSEKIDYSELVSYQIKGANGYLNKRGRIVVPTSEAGDEYFKNLTKKLKIRSNQKIPYFYPIISEFDALIAYYDLTLDQQVIVDQIVNASIPLIENNYIGFIADTKDQDQITKTIAIFSILLEVIKSNSRQDYTMIHDTVSNQGKELYLIKRTSKRY